MDASHQTELINSRNNLESYRQQYVSGICTPTALIPPPENCGGIWVCAMCYAKQFIYFALEQQLL